ncbi:hypothetical protein [Actinophytocola sp.]|uniref:hypothetical protein n=1 Tax=Actinophytocola sp. TaxID=1872138 RepID=UPI002ECFB73D
MSDENDFLHGLEVEVEAELTITESSHPEEVADLPISEWQFDATDAERYEVGLRGLLGAVEAMEDGPSQDRRP